MLQIKHSQCDVEQAVSWFLDPMEYVYQIVHRTRSNKIDKCIIVYQDGPQGRTNDLMNTPPLNFVKNKKEPLKLIMVYLKLVLLIWYS